MTTTTKTTFNGVRVWIQSGFSEWMSINAKLKLSLCFAFSLVLQYHSVSFRSGSITFPFRPLAVPLTKDSMESIIFNLCFPFRIDRYTDLSISHSFKCLGILMWNNQCPNEYENIWFSMKQPSQMWRCYPKWKANKWDGSQ